MIVRARCPSHEVAQQSTGSSVQEHRATFYLPYWNIPLSDIFVPRLRDFAANLAILDEQLDDLVRRAIATKQEDDIEALQARDYTRIQDPSLLRFLADMRGEDLTGKMLRDDLMTFLIAGHETTAAVLTWATFLLTQNPDKMRKLQAEVDAVLGDDMPTADTIRAMPYLRNVRRCPALSSVLVAVTLSLLPSCSLCQAQGVACRHLPRRCACTHSRPSSFAATPKS